MSISKQMKAIAIKRVREGNLVGANDICKYSDTPDLTRGEVFRMALYAPYKIHEKGVYFSTLWQMLEYAQDLYRLEPRTGFLTVKDRDLDDETIGRLRGSEKGVIFERNK